MSVDRETRSWVAADDEFGRIRGRLFAITCLASTLFGITMVGVLLVYVFLDATRILEAEWAWFGVHLTTSVGVPVAVGTLLYQRSRTLLWSGLSTIALTLFSLMLAGGAIVAFTHAVSFVTWLGLVIALGVATLVHVGHTWIRDPPAAQRTLVGGLSYWFALVGVPGLSVDTTLSVPGTDLTLPISLAFPELVPSLLEVVTRLPLVPTRAVTAMATVAVPLAGIVWLVIHRNRDRPRSAKLTAAVVGTGAGLAWLVAWLVGSDPWAWIVVGAVGLTLLGLHLEALADDDELLALALPVGAIVGIAAGVGLSRSLEVQSPPTWLDWSFLHAAHSEIAQQAGIYPALVGSVLMMIVVALASFPLGVGAALYLEEYAPDTGIGGWIVTIIEINISNLAGVPSVVYGLLGLAVFIRLLGMDTGIVIVGGLTIALLILPIVIISAREAIRSVPDSLRQASYGMGATRWQTVRRVVLPEAMPGILTGTIIAFGRAIGETAPLLMIGAAATVFEAPNGFFDSFSAMPRQIYSWVSYPEHAFQYGVMAAGVVTLLVVLLSMNAAAIVIRNRYQRRSSR